MGKGKSIIEQIKYPKFTLLILTFVFAYLLFESKDVSVIHNALLSLGYFGTFFAGTMFTYGFTTAPAIAILLILAKSQNILIAGLIAGFGALVGDLVIFQFIRSSFDDELEKLSHESIIIRIKQNVPRKIQHYLLPVLGGIIIASPLPDELGVSMLASSKNISTKLFMVISYIMNTAGIFAILLLGRAI